MSVASLPKCCGFIVSVSYFRECRENANKSRKIPSATRKSDPESLSGTGSPPKVNQFFLLNGRSKNCSIWCWALPSPFNFSINFQMEISPSLQGSHWTAFIDFGTSFFYFSCSSVMFLVLVVNFCRAHFNLTAYLNFCSGRLFVFDRKDWARPVSDSWICCSVWFRGISVSFWAYISRIMSTRITSHRIVW